MKTFNQFCSEAYNLDENLIQVAKNAANSPIGKRIIGRTHLGRAVRGALGSEVLRRGVDSLPPQVKKVGNELLDIGFSGLGMGPAAPAVVGLTAATKFLTPVGKKMHQARGERDAAARRGLENSPSTRDMSPGERERLVQGTRLRGV